MANIISSIADTVHSELNPAYRLDKEEMREAVQMGKIIAVAGLVATSALAVLGISISVGAGAALIAGLPLIAVSLPLGYLSYNSYRVFDNLLDVCHNPKNYQRFFGFDDAYHKDKIRSQMVNGTIFFDWFVDMVISNMVKDGLAR